MPAAEADGRRLVAIASANLPGSEMHQIQPEANVAGADKFVNWKGYCSRAGRLATSVGASQAPSGSSLAAVPYPLDSR